jgi:hypothetical protein
MIPFRADLATPDATPTILPKTTGRWVYVGCSRDTSLKRPTASSLAVRPPCIPPSTRRLRRTRAAACRSWPTRALPGTRCPPAEAGRGVARLRARADNLTHRPRDLSMRTLATAVICGRYCWPVALARRRGTVTVVVAAACVAAPRVAAFSLPGLPLTGLAYGLRRSGCNAMTERTRASDAVWARIGH